MKRTYHGGRHCGVVRFECELDLAEGYKPVQLLDLRKVAALEGDRQARCVPAAAGRGGALGPKHSPCLLQPLRRQAVRAGTSRLLGGTFCGVNIACLDEAPPDELAAAPVIYEDGRNDDRGEPPAVTYHL
jgi:hypothetical protein